MTAPRGKMLGIDYGIRKIGLAISSEDGKFVFGRGVVNVTGRKALFEHLRELIAKEKILGIVVGYPRSLDGSEGPNVTNIQKFVEQLGAEFGLPVVTEDERFSTDLAQTLAHPDHTSSTSDDEGAARVILQAYLDRLRST